LIKTILHLFLKAPNRLNANPKNTTLKDV